MVALVLLSLTALPPAAFAHPGNNWGQTAVTAARNIVGADYTYVFDARCYAPDRALQHATAARSWVRNDIRYWNHLACRLRVAGPNTQTCWVLFHQTGLPWYAFSLTRYPLRDAPSCTPYDLGRRR